MCKPIKDSAALANISTALYILTSIFLILWMIQAITLEQNCSDCPNAAYWAVVEIIPFFCMIGAGYLNAAFASKKSKEGDEVGLNGVLIVLIVLCLIWVFIAGFLKLIVLTFAGIFGGPGFGTAAETLTFLTVFLVHFLYSIVLMVFSCVSLISRT